MLVMPGGASSVVASEAISVGHTTIALPGFLVDHFPLAVTEEFVRLDKLIYDRRDLPQIKAIAT